MTGWQHPAWCAAEACVAGRHRSAWLISTAPGATAVRVRLVALGDAVAAELVLGLPGREHGRATLAPHQLGQLGDAVAALMAPPTPQPAHRGWSIRGRRRAVAR